MKSDDERRLTSRIPKTATPMLKERHWLGASVADGYPYTIGVSDGSSQQG
jgi:hypothetical protein